MTVHRYLSHLCIERHVHEDVRAEGAERALEAALLESEEDTPWRGRCVVGEFHRHGGGRSSFGVGALLRRDLLVDEEADAVRRVAVQAHLRGSIGGRREVAADAERRQERLVRRIAAPYLEVTLGGSPGD